MILFRTQQAMRISRESKKQTLLRAEEALTRLRAYPPHAGLRTDAIVTLCRCKICG